MSVRLKRYKKDFEHSYTFGVFPTIELLTHQPEHVHSVLLHSKGEANRGIAVIQALAERHNIRAEVNDSGIERLTNKGNDYAVGVLHKYEAPLHSEANHVVLVNPSDIGNLGTIMRTMLAFGINQLSIITPAVDVFDPRTIRASMGALFQLCFASFPSFEAYWTRFPQHQLYPFMTDGAHALGEVMFSVPWSLILGNESAGLPDHFSEIGTPVAIPISDRVDSLNLSIAAGIALYAAAKPGQRPNGTPK